MSELLNRRESVDLHIIAILQHGKLKRQKRYYFIDMELCDFNLEGYRLGKSISSLEAWETIRSQGRVKYCTIDIMKQIVEGLVFIHAHEEVHRDLTPQNGKFMTSNLN